MTQLVLFAAPWIGSPADVGVSHGDATSMF